jgi:transcriptional regulator with XRE-family HTH domain
MDEGPCWTALAAALTARRRELRLSQAELAARGGPSEITVSNLERGRVTSWVREKTKRQLEDALNWPDGLIDRILYGSVSAEEAKVQTARPVAAPVRGMSDAPVHRSDLVHLLRSIATELNAQADRVALG